MPHEKRRKSTKAELRARVVGKALDYHREDIAFWQAASEQSRGQTLYELLRRTEAIRASIPATRQARQRLILYPGRIEIQMAAE